ncbi:MAG: hypothetical protein K9W44_00850 [Candidatus Lokiarchaeota archaeon]|nr:hypothetical protein [Candidatus Harpocratesius repetitus]
MRDSCEKTINLMKYRVIVCKYNELGLKSSTYQTQLLNILMDSIKKICKREHLTLQSIISLPGRILCFFPSQEIIKALLIFKYIIGIQVFAPAITSPRKLEILSQKCVDYLSLLYQIHPFSSVTLVLKGNKNLINEYNSFSTELKQIIDINCQNAKLPINFTESSPDITLRVEFRKKGTYLYHLEYPTHFAGFPIESKKVFLLPWTNSPDEFLAGMLMVRRGSIVIPISIIQTDNYSDNKSKKKDLKNERNLLTEIAKYYADPLPWIKISQNELNNISNDFAQSRNEVWLKVLEKLCILSIERAFIHMGNRKLHFKGIIVPNSFESRIFRKENLKIPVFYPLIGFSFGFIQRIMEEYEHDPWNFSFHRFISQKSWESPSFLLRENKKLINPQKKAELQFSAQKSNVEINDSIILKIKSNLRVNFIIEEILESFN